MSDKIETALKSIEELLRREGVNLTEMKYKGHSYKEFLFRAEESITTSPTFYDDTWMRANLTKWMWNGFFKCAAGGYEFVPESRIKEKFGRSLQENYPDAGDAFMRFARTFWTLKLVEIDLREHYDLVLFKVISEMNNDYIGRVFFPNRPDSKVQMGSKMESREEIEREWIVKSGAPINVDEFLSGNPIIRDSKLAANRGCLGVVLALIISTIILTTLIYLGVFTST